MRYHVDIIEIDPLVDAQTLIGRVYADGDVGLTLEAESEDQLRETVERIVPDISPEAAPIEFLTKLAECCDYTYMIASAPHEAHDCPFAGIGATIKGAVTHHAAQPA